MTSAMRAPAFAAGVMAVCAVTAPIATAKNDTFVEELEEFAAAVRGGPKPEVGGEYATESLAVVRAGILSAREGRRVEVAEVLKND